MIRNPVVGDLIKVKGSRSTLVVVETKQDVSEDRARGDAYYGQTFDTIGFDHVGDRTSSNPKVKKFYLNTSSMGYSDRTCVALSDIELVGFSEVRKHVEVTYGFGRVKAAKA